MVHLRPLLACAALFSAAAAPAAYDFYVTVKAAAVRGPGGPVYLFVEKGSADAGIPSEPGVIRLTCANRELREAAVQWSSSKKMMGAPKIGEATAVTSISLPKITPKIAKESHGKFRTMAPGWQPVEVADPLAACAAAAEAARIVNGSRRDAQPR